jgi:hypothetical protein
MKHEERPSSGYIGWLCEHPECKPGQAAVLIACDDCMHCLYVRLVGPIRKLDAAMRESADIVKAVTQSVERLGAA